MDPLGLLGGGFGSDAGLFCLVGSFLGFASRAGAARRPLTLALLLLGAAALGIALLAQTGRLEARLLAGGELRIVGRILLLGLLEQGLLGLGLGFQSVGERVFGLQRLSSVALLTTRRRWPPASWRACDPRG